MVEKDVWNDHVEEAVVIDHGLLGWAKDHLSPEMLTLAIGGILTLCICGVAGGRDVSVKLGPLVIDVN